MDYCAWCGKWKEVHAWRECIGQDYDGGEIHAPICRDCYEFVTGTCPELNTIEEEEPLTFEVESK